MKNVSTVVRGGGGGGSKVSLLGGRITPGWILGMFPAKMLELFIGEKKRKKELILQQVTDPVSDSRDS